MQDTEDPEGIVLILVDDMLLASWLVPMLDHKYMSLSLQHPLKLNQEYAHESGERDLIGVLSGRV